MGDRQIIEAVRKLAGVQFTDQVSTIACTVNSVDIAARTCDCTPISGEAGTDIPNVALMAEVEDGFLLIPEVDSTVFVVYSKYNPPYVSLFSKIAGVLFTSGTIQFNDGSFGGLTKTPELRDQLNKTNQLLTAILDVLNGPPINEPGSGAPSALQTALKAALVGEALGDYTSIENEIVTHGT